MFDSKKKVKLTNAEGVEYKLAKKQLQAIDFNKALLSMYTNQVPSKTLIVVTRSKRVKLELDFFHDLFLYCCFVLNRQTSAGNSLPVFRLRTQVIHDRSSSRLLSFAGKSSIAEPLSCFR